MEASCLIKDLTRTGGGGRGDEGGCVQGGLRGTHFCVLLHVYLLLLRCIAYVFITTAFCCVCVDDYLRSVTCVFIDLA